MTHRTFLLALACGAALLVLAGCGSSAQPRTAAGVRATVNRFLSDLTAADGKDACALMDANAKAQLRAISKVGSCEHTITVASGLDTATAAQRSQLRGYAASVPITVHGDTATLPSTGGDRTGRLVYQHGHWLFDNS